MQTSEEILCNKYNLQRDIYKNSDVFHDKVCKYEVLLLRSQKNYSNDKVERLPLDDHFEIFRNTMDSSSIAEFKEHYADGSQTKTDLDKAINLIEKIITPDIDRALKSYFHSNYAVLWYNWAVVESVDSSKFTANKWHCDAGPTVHLKTITYFDNTSDHGSSTRIGDVASTQQLKDIGYLLNDISFRQIDISDLTDFYDINLKIEEPNFSTGDSIMFNPTQRMHQISLPKPGMYRHCFTLCYIPSPIAWQDLIEHGFSPVQGGCSFEHAAKKILAIDDKLNEKPACNSNFPSSDENIHNNNKVDKEKIVELDIHGRISTSYSLLHHLQIIFEDKAYAARLHKSIIGNGTVNINFAIDELLIKLKQSFQQDINWNGIFDPKDLKNLQDLIEFEKNYYYSNSRYTIKGKPNVNAIMWPNPTHEKYPKSRFDMMPYVNRYKIMDMSTPVASAGSCFAFEIARSMQEQNFNYLIEERADNPSDGIIVDGYSAGDKYAKFSANYGILFNTPSLLQLAQRAFNLRHFEHYCNRLENGMYMDPYRENVFYVNKNSYINDHPKHIAAVRRVLTNVKVMIFTAGLNECWQLRDGTVLSRNPKSGFYHLLKYRVLSVQENIDNISGFVEIVRRFNPDFKLVISLSPIPLLATGRAETHHIIEANTHSKSVLRVAIDEVVRELDGVFYLPSYELVKECSKDPWEDDHRHVTRETVNRVVSMFKDIFVA